MVTVLGDPMMGPDFQTMCELPTVPGLVEYQYNVTTPTMGPLFVTVEDDQLGAIVENHELAGGGTTETFFVKATLDQETQNIATVTAAFDNLGTQVCAGDESNTVLVKVPPPPPFTG